MRVRYTATAAREFVNGIEYLTQQAPSIVAEFADAIERAVKEVAEVPLLAQETEKRACAANMFGASTTPFFIRSKTARLSCFTSGTPRGDCPGRTKDSDFLRPRM